MRKKAVHILLLFLIVSLAACTTTAAKKQDEAAAGVPAITSVSISDNAVEIKVSGDFIYTAYKPSDPYTIAIDMPGVSAGAVAGKVASDKKGISEVTVTASETPSPGARVEILLESPSAIETTKENNVLTITLKEEEAAEPEPVAMPEPPSEPAPEEEAVLPPATRIEDMKFDYTDGKVDLVIKADGSMTPDVFALKRRIVIDVPDVSMEAAVPAAVVSPVRGIRHGLHDGKVRIVVDLKQEVEFTTAVVGDSLVVSLPAPAEVVEILTAEAEAVPSEVPLVEAPEEVSEKYTGKIISLDFQNADIVPIFRFLGDVSGYNVVVHPTVGGRVTLKLMNVPWDQALDIILDIFGLEKQIEGNILTIAPSSVFDKIAKEKKARQQTESVTVELERKVFRLVNIDVAEMKKIIDEEKLVSPRGRVRIDERLNTLIVRDTPQALRSIGQTIEAEDIPEKRTMQVMIEAKIVEVTSDSDRDLGIKWGGNFVADLGGPDGAVSGDFSVNTPPMPAGASVDAAGAAVNLLIGTVDTLQVNVSLEALETVGKLKKLSNPKVLTIDGEKANIQQGVQIPVSTTTAEGSTTEFRNANLSLDVTPTVNLANGTIELKVRANNDTPISVGGETGINTQSIETRAIVKDGETLVLGGIYTNSEEVSERGVPGLRKIPILGWLFKSRKDTISTKELLILITPTILKE